MPQSKVTDQSRPPLRRNPRLLALLIRLKPLRPSVPVRRSPRLHQSAAPPSSVSNIYHEPFGQDPPYLKPSSRLSRQGRQELRELDDLWIYASLYRSRGLVGLNIIFPRSENPLSAMDSFLGQRVFRRPNNYKFLKRL